MSENHQEAPPIDAFDTLRNPRCPQLGDVVSFNYCRNENHGTPCKKVVFCWGHRFDVDRYLRVHFDADVIEGLSEPPKDKRQSLVDLIRRAKEANGSDPPAETAEQ